ncbi:hypothetical protein E8E14_014991 [Neopestalotiopsis sp. 37M]|nr:hypothetical protein E8E14_014991 [Neopestalotiopsis sp. 37M]
MSSTWNEHWCCEEVMLDKTKGGRQEEGSNSPRLFVSNPPPQLIHLRSLELSLNVPYAALHNHQEHRERQQHTATLRPNAWADVCVALSDLSLLQRRGDGISEDGNNGHGSDDDATLRNVSLRLDLVEDDRFWWEVRESSALSAIRGPLRARLALQLPELTVDVDRIKMFQYESSPPSPSESPVPGQQNQGKAEDGQEVRGDIGTDNQPFLVYPLPSYLRTPPGGNAKKRLVPDFKSLKRYSRRRWTSTTTTEDRVNDGIESRLEFFTPREHATNGPEDLVHRMGGLFRGMLMA